MNYYYLILDLICLGCPLLLSFDRRVAYYKKWPSVLVSIIFICLLFIPWDMYFTGLGVWGFNSDYLLGISVFNLPLEEVLFFITVPFACIFIYECVRYYLKSWITFVEQHMSKWWLVVFLLLSVLLTIMYRDRYYTVIVIVLTTIITTLSVLYARKYVSISLISFLIIGIPFYFINSALTGLYSDAPVVWYSEWGISNLRAGTIPMEDFYYNLLLFVMSLFFYIGWQRKVLKKPIDLDDEI